MTRRDQRQRVHIVEVTLDITPRPKFTVVLPHVRVVLTGRRLDEAADILRVLAVEGVPVTLAAVLALAVAYGLRADYGLARPAL